MKKIYVVLNILLISAIFSGQTGAQQHSPMNQPGLNEKNYVLTGTRHGVSFFPKVRLKSVQYISGDSLSFEEYHSLEVIYNWLHNMG